jgi:hypothetical protein
MCAETDLWCSPWRELLEPSDSAKTTNQGRAATISVASSLAHMCRYRSDSASVRDRLYRADQLEVDVSGSRNVNDLPVSREPLPLEANWDGPGALWVNRIHGLNMYVGLGAVARVAAPTDCVTDGNGLPD